MDELEALRIWYVAKKIPSDVRQGIGISIDKIERILSKSHPNEPRRDCIRRVRAILSAAKENGIVLTTSAIAAIKREHGAV